MKTYLRWRRTKPRISSTPPSERIVEHVFVGEALRSLWKHNIRDVEVLPSEFDGHGYDLVMVRGALIRHIQFKTSTRKRPDHVSVAASLAQRPSGCVLWISINASTLDLGPYYWFGSSPGEPLPSIDSYSLPLRATRNKEGLRPPRLNHRKVPGSQFIQLTSSADVLRRLFGETIFSGHVNPQAAASPD